MSERDEEILLEHRWRFENDYMKTWNNGFYVLLGWTPEQIDEWAEKWRPEITDAATVFFHWPPCDYMLNSLIPEEMKSRLARLSGGTANIRRMADMIMLAIRRANPNRSVDSFSEHDWSIAKKNIASTINEFNAEGQFK